ncbi:MAG: DUF6912 family protein [Marmoricola sp.]
MRVYVPASLALLRDWVASDAVPAEAPERFVAEDEQEESEYAALMAAADESRSLGAARRVVVVAALPGGDPDVSFPVGRIVAVHVDEPGAAAEDDLGWYAPEEIAHLLE